MEHELRARLIEHFGHEPVRKKSLEFALSSRTRAVAMLDRIALHTGLDVRGKRVLDVGSAYGGFVVEAAARGAEAWGVEISERLYGWGAIHARGEPGDIHLVHADFLSRRIQRELPRDFDLVIVNDVFEHVYDTAALLKQLHGLVRPGGMFAFSIPNGDAVSAVEREGHDGVPGLTLLPPNRWHRLVPGFTAYYRPWSYYSGLFRAFGFGQIEPWRGARKPDDAVRAEIRAGLVRAADAVGGLEVDGITRSMLDTALAEYRAAVEEDLAGADAGALKWRYLTTFWKGCAVKVGPVSADLDEQPAPVPVTRRLAPARVLGQLRALARRARPAPTPPAPAVEPWRPVSLAIPTDGPPSRWCRGTTVHVSTSEGVLRCEVVGSDAEGLQYGGVRIPLARPARLRLDLELLDPENIEVLYLAGESARRARCLRWHWNRPSAGRRTVELTAGQPSGLFIADEPTLVDDVADLHVFVRIRPGTRTTFLLHAVAS
jgi:SAM-dependent methyltransferase